MAFSFVAEGVTVVTSAFTAKATSRSYFIWSYRTGDGDSGFGRMWDASAPGTDVFANDSAGVYNYLREWTGGNAQWSITRPSASAWHALGVTYDASSTSNAPVIYVDGSSVSVTTAAVATGSLINTAGAYTIGNRADVAREWDGYIAEFAMWDGLLSADDHRSLARGKSPREIRPEILVEHLPCVRSQHSSVISPAASGSPTAVVEHPRTIRRRPMRWNPVANYVAPPPFNAAYAAGLNTVIVDGRPI